MINRNNQDRNLRKTKGWRRLTAWLCAFMLLISSGGVNAFADGGEIYSAPATAPGNQVRQTPAPEEPAGEPEKGEPEEGVILEEGETPEEATKPEEGEEPEKEQEPEQVYEPGTLTTEAEGCSIRIDYPAEARIPEGAALTASLVQGADLYTVLKTAARLIKYEDHEIWDRQVSGENSRIYALTLTDAEGNEIKPSAGMTLTYTNPDSPEGVIYCITGDNERLLELTDGSMTVEDYRLEPFGYTAVEKVQVGTVTLQFSGNDYTVTAAYGPEAGFPADTELKVREILPGTPEYALYSGMTEEALDEEWKEITLERYFDITFISGGRELEPQADVDVQILFRDTIELTEEHDVQAVHIENNEASVIEADTESNGAAKNDNEAIDTVSFTSGSFSVFGVVQRKKITEKVLAADGQTYEIEVTYGPEAEIPEGALLKVEEIPEGSELWEAYRKQTAAALGSDDVRMPGLYDITILDAEGNEVEPKAAVNVSITLANADSGEDLHVVHFTEEIPEEQVRSEMQAEGQPLPTEDQISSEKIDANVDGNTVTFETDGFSVYAFAYEVVYYYKTASGETYLIRLDYDADSGIPAGSELNVEEILPEDARYAEYLEAAIRAAKKASEHEKENTQTEEEPALTIPADQYARFFDIEIRYNGEKIEPAGNISVTIQLTDAPEERLEALAVVHFADEGTEVLNADVSAEAIQFDTESFSVYGVITMPDEPTGVNNLDGYTAKIGIGERYLSQVVLNTETTQRLGKCNKDEAATWFFESTGTDNVYHIYTLVDGQRRYMHFERQDGSRAHVTLSEDPQGLTVSPGNNGTYQISYTDNETTYYLNEFSGSGGNGFAGWAAQNDNNAMFHFDFSTTQTGTGGEEYIVVVKYGGRYYAVLNEGKLQEVEYNEDDQTVKTETPMFWTLGRSADNQNYVLYHADEAYDYTYQNLASDYYYRYIDPRQDGALSKDDENNTSPRMEWWGDPVTNNGGKLIDTRQLMTDAAFTYNDHTITSVQDPSKVLRVTEEDGELKIAGGNSEGDVAEVYFAKMIQPENSLILGPKYHTVDHIDISVEAQTVVHVPLAYGTYYYVENGQVKTLVVSRENQVTLTLRKTVEVEADDLRDGIITAYKKENDTVIPMNEAFIVNGYSSNSENGQSTDQVRIAGIFKVADLENVPNNTDPNGDDDWREQRLAKENRIYYSIYVDKEVELYMEYNQHQLYMSQEDAEASLAGGYDVSTDENAMKVNPSIALTASFDYWDPRNECPGIHLLGHTDAWTKGDVFTSYDPGAGVAANSGMDFALGSTEKDDQTVKAIEITKLIVNKSGERISPEHELKSLFHVHTKKTDKNDEHTPVNDVRNLDVGAYDPDDSRNETVHDGYTALKNIKVNVGKDGMGVMYDYDMTDSMVYIEEDQSPQYLPMEITDENGKLWVYAYTYFETEYVWRDDGIEYQRHVSDQYTTGDEHYNSIPDVVGAYRDINGIDRYNGFLEFYAYNVYEPEPVDIPVRKIWKQENGSTAEAPEDARITVTVGRYHLAEDEENPITGSLRIGQTTTGLAENVPFRATYTIKKDGDVIKTVSYNGYGNGSGETLVSGLPSGSYTVETESKADGYSITNEPTVQNVTIINGDTTSTSFASTCTLNPVEEKVTVIVTNSIGNKNDNWWNTYQNLEYRFPAGSTIVVNISRPGPGHNGAFRMTVTVKDNGTDLNYNYIQPTHVDGQNDYAGVTQSLEFTLPASGDFTIDIWHDWGEESLTVDSVILKDPDDSSDGNGKGVLSFTTGKANSSRLSVTAENSQNHGTGDNEPTPKALSKAGVTRASGTTGISQNADNDYNNPSLRPASPIEGMIYVPDTVMVGDQEILWSETVILTNGAWEKWLEDMPATDDHGHEYLYFIMSVEEEGLPEGTNASTGKPVITLGDGGKILTSTGEETLSFTNTVPNQPVNLSIKKVDENGIPMTGVQFKLMQTGQADKDFTITSGDGTYTFEGLTAGSYAITETTALPGYQGMQGSIEFTVSPNYVLTTTGTLPDGVTYDGETICYQVVNHPIQTPNTLVVRKQWLDYNGNVTSYNGTIELQLLQWAPAPPVAHKVTVNVQCDGNGNGGYNSNGQVTPIGTRTGEGFGDASIYFDWDQWTDNQNCTVNIISGNCTYYDGGLTYEGANPSRGRRTFHFTNITSDVTINVTIYNGGWKGTADNLIGNITFSGTSAPTGEYAFTGGTKTVLLGQDGNWSQTFTLAETGSLEDSGNVLPSKYNGEDCYYTISEDSVPAGFTLSQISTDMTNAGVLTAYNKRIAADISVIKVDRENRTQPLAGATFELRAIDPRYYGVSYLNQTVQERTTALPDGKVSFDNLGVGYYEIRETAAPPNYTIPGDGCFYIRVGEGGVYCLEKDPNKFPEKWRGHANNSLFSINRGSVITIGDEPDYGALKITKAVTVNGEAPTEENAGLTDGTYRFTIEGVDDEENLARGEEHTLEITFENGAAVSYQIDRELPVALTAEETAAAEPGTWSVLVSDLKPGTYTITETESGSLTLTGISGGVTGTSDTEAGTVTVTVFPGKNDEESIAGDEEAQARVEYTNNTDAQPIALRKRSVVKDNEGHWVYLAGAEFQIYTWDEYEKGEGSRQPMNKTALDAAAATYFLEDEVTMRSVTDSTGTGNGRFYQGCLGSGKYVLVETKAPDGYLNVDPIGFEVTTGGFTWGYYPAYATTTVPKDGSGYYTLYVDDIPTTSVGVTKEWKNACGETEEPANGSVTLQLYRGTGTTEAEAVADAAAQTTSFMTVVLNGTPDAAAAGEGVEAYPPPNNENAYEDTAWHALFTGLPQYNGDVNHPYAYIVKEAELNGYTVKYDADETAVYVQDGGTVTNTQNPVTGHPEVSKTLTGRDWQAGDTFTFTLTAKADDHTDGADGPSTAQAVTAGKIGMPDPATAVLTAVTENDTIVIKDADGNTVTDGKAIFGNITFKEEGTYTFEIMETTGTTAGIAYSQKKVYAQFAVSESEGGVLSLTGPTYAEALTDAGEAGALQYSDTVQAFTNTYDTSVTVQIEGQKVLTNGTITADQFSFTLNAEEGVPMPDEEGGETAGTAATTGVFAFGGITYPLSVMSGVTAVNGVKEKIYSYTVTENLPAGTEITDADRTAGYKIVNGIRYHLTPYPVTVTLTYTEATGVLEAEVTPQKTKFTITNEQLGSVQVIKRFIFPAGSSLTVPQNFQITASWTVDETAYTAVLTTTSSTLTPENPDYTISVPSGNDPYTWTIANLPVGTQVTFGESNFMIDGYYPSSTVSVNGGEAVEGTTGTASAAATPGTVALENTYTAGAPLPLTGGSGTLIYTAGGLVLVLLAGVILIARRKRKHI